MNEKMEELNELLMSLLSEIFDHNEFIERLEDMLIKAKLNKKWLDKRQRDTRRLLEKARDADHLQNSWDRLSTNENFNRFAENNPEKYQDLLLCLEATRLKLQGDPA